MAERAAWSGVLDLLRRVGLPELVLDKHPHQIGGGQARRLLDRLFDFDEIRVHSRRPESRNGFAERLSRDLGKPVVATEDWESCVRGADIVVEASRLPEPAPLLKTDWIAKGVLLVPHGTMSAVELSLTDIMDKMVVDDWGQCRKGLPFGALRPMSTTAG
ncbi:ornithine cyclodeaminase/alanine dehydrogenase-like protein (mu-crystallin family) [Azospirillum agricola]|uniref:hypothetical protein n=1 Tax=Azospirillum agricola TaxID=1720247 RepID=UPI001AE70C82|nr:hypothetical protein [Azospirillum agricola]MBP2229221.1 ornithine cyclodeaminase/alanine dehydrogenase-like protein (mu-crystallin family) [Azospirillum agricola]